MKKTKEKVGVMSFSKRVIVILLSLVMVLTYIPALAFAAEEGEEVTDNPQTTEETLDEEQPADLTADAQSEDHADAAEPARGNASSEKQEENDVNPEAQGSGSTGSSKAGGTDASATDNEEAQVTITGTELSYSVNIKPDVELADSDELLMQFLDKEVSSEVPASRPGLLKASRATRGSKLSPNSKLVYNELVTYVNSIASGDCERTDTYVFPVNNLDFNHDKWYKASDLGVDSIYDEDGDISEDAYYGILKVLGYEAEAQPRSDKVVNSLLADFPYEMYWYDKLAGTKVIIDKITSGKLVDTNEPVLNLQNAILEFKFTVAGGDANTGYPEYGYRSVESDPYLINSAKVNMAKTAAKNAKAIIDSHKEAGVYDCLDAYREEILSLNTYDHEAAAAPAAVYGDPWQMIYVFDDNTSTNAVCEGYSKAFQFLVDHTDHFNEKGIECYSILGKMSRNGRNLGSHMWNIVTMDDGKNYMADLTNCDTGSIGAPDKLFLKGCMPGGSVESGYEFNIDADDESDLLYTYSNQALSLYDEELVLTDETYLPAPKGSIESIEFIRNGGNTIRILNGTVGYMDSDSGFFRYGYYEDISKMFIDGDILRIKYQDSDQPVDYTFYEYSRKYGGRKRFIHDKGNGTYNGYTCNAFGFGSNQNGKWEDGGTGYEFYITHKDTDQSVKAVCPVEIFKKRGIAPTGVTTIRNTIANSAKKTNDVIWDTSKVKGATAYEINWRARGASKWATRKVGKTVRGTTSGLTIGNLYEIRVRPYFAETSTTTAAYGAWSGTVYRYFHTTQKIRLASKRKGTFTMSWAKNPKATGYQILYTTNKNGSGAANNIVNIGAKATSVTRSNIKVNGKTQALKSGMTYYVQVREIRKVGGKNYIGNISCPVAVKVK